MKSRTDSNLKVGDRIVYITRSWAWPTMRFGTITNITEGYLETRVDYFKRTYQFHVPGRIEVIDTKGKKRFTRGQIVYKLEEVNKFFDEVK